MKIKVFPETKSDNGSILDVSFVRSESQSSLRVFVWIWGKGEMHVADRRLKGTTIWVLCAKESIRKEHFGFLLVPLVPKARSIGPQSGNTKTPEVIQISQGLPSGYVKIAIENGHL